MSICAQDFLDWLAPGSFFTGKLSEKFESISIEADAIHETILCDELSLVHMEFQSGPDPDMAQRLLEYLILAFDKNDLENQEWIIRRFAVLQDIFRDTPAYQYIAEEAREEGREEERERQLRARLRVQRKLLLAIVEAHFPALVDVAKKQVEQIKDITTIEDITVRVGTAKTSEEAQHHLLAWKQDRSNPQSKKKSIK